MYALATSYARESSWKTARSAQSLRIGTDCSRTFQPDTRKRERSERKERSYASDAAEAFSDFADLPEEESSF